jgi:aspartate aminotransferase
MARRPPNGAAPIVHHRGPSPLPDPTLSPSRAPAAARPQPGAPRLSRMAGSLSGSEILKIAAEIRALVAAGQKVCNLTVGDFDARQFPIPALLDEQIRAALTAGETNYPPSDGVLVLRQALQRFYRSQLGLDYPVESVLIAGGARPLLYGIYRTVLDRGDKVVYPVPSWNNNHYCTQVGAIQHAVPCAAEESFLPTRARLQQAIRGARLLAINSPLNPTGTAFTEEVLGDLCDMVLEENARRGPNERPLYLMYDHVYWMLTFGGVKHVTPVALRPEMRDYTLFIDGISKAFAATGLRVGWIVGPTDVIRSMSHLLGHVGAWAPRPEQIATAKLLDQPDAIAAYHEKTRREMQTRLDALHAGLTGLKQAGFPVDALRPMGAIYLTARFALAGKRTKEGATLRTNEEIRRYLLNAAGCALVPFQAFGMAEESGWFRMSIGAVSPADIDAMFPRVKAALAALV